MNQEFSKTQQVLPFFNDHLKKQLSFFFQLLLGSFLVSIELNPVNSSQCTALCGPWLDSGSDATELTCPSFGGQQHQGLVSSHNWRSTVLNKNGFMWAHCKVAHCLLTHTHSRSRRPTADVSCLPWCISILVIESGSLIWTQSSLIG